MAASDARPIPRKNVAYRVTFPIFDADGDLVTGASSPDSEVSKDGGTFADCTNEATEIATSSGMYYLDLTATEMDADTVAIIVKTGTAGAKTTPIVLYPEEAGDLRADVVQISGDSTAADNAESFFDGTGYAGTGNTIPTVTTLTNAPSDSSGTTTLLSRVGTPSNLGGGATLAANLSDIEAQTDDIGTAGAGLTALGDTRLANLDATVSSRLATAGYTTPPTVGAIADQVWDEATVGHTTSGTFGEQLKTDVDAILVDTAEIGAAGAGLTAIPWNAAWDAEVQSEAADALVAYDPPTNAEMEARTLVAASYATAAGVSAVETDTQDIQGRLPALLVSGRIDASVGAMAANVMTAAAAAADLTTELQSGLSTLTAAQVNSEVDTALADVGLTTTITGRIDAAVSTRLAGAGYTAPPSANDNADALLDRAAGIETGLTPRQAFRLMAAALAGKLSGAATTTITIRNAVTDSKARITATVDSDGNRSAVSTDLT